MKKINISPEWILETFPDAVQADGQGNITIITDNWSNSHWIDLALETMCIYYDNDVFDNVFDNDLDRPHWYGIYWTFKIQDIKEDCPNLYAQWTEMDLINSAFNREN